MPAPQGTLNEYVNSYKEYLQNSSKENNDLYLASGLADSTDEYIAYKILGKKPGDFAPEPDAASTTEGGDNIEVTPTPTENPINTVVKEESSGDGTPGDSSTMQDNNLGPVYSNNNPEYPYNDFLDITNPVDKILSDALSDQTENEVFEDDAGNIINLSDKKVYSPVSDTGSYRLSHTVSDSDYSNLVTAVDSGGLKPTDKLSSLQYEDASVDLSNVEANRMALVDAKEPMVETSVDSLIKHPNGTPMKVTLAETAARRFESANKELQALGINLIVGSHKVSHESQLARHEQYLAGELKTPVSHPDRSWHTIGYAIDLAMPKEYGMYDNREAIAEVMKRHGWNQHPDEWWHFSVDALDSVYKKGEEKPVTEPQPFTRENDKDGVPQFVLARPRSGNEDFIWQSYDKNITLYQNGATTSEIVDRAFQRNRADIASLIVENGNVMTPELKQKIVLRNIDPETLAQAQKDFMYQVRFVAMENGATFDEMQMDEAVYADIKEKYSSGMLGVNFSRVFGLALENSFTGMITSQLMGHGLDDVNAFDAQLVRDGVLEPLNWVESGLTMALQFMMPVDAALMYFTGGMSAAAYNTIMKKQMGSWIRKYVVSNGLAYGNKATGISNKVVRLAMQKGTGTAVARLTQTFGVYDGSRQAFREVFDENADMIQSRDANGNPILDKDGNYTYEVNPESAAGRIWDAYLHGVGVGATFAVLPRLAGKPASEFVSKWSSANLPVWLDKIGQQGYGMIQVIPEWMAFNWMGYKQAKIQGHQKIKDDYFYRFGKPAPQIHVQSEWNKIWKDEAWRVAAETTGFLLSMRALHSIAPGISGKLENPQAKARLYQKLHSRIEKQLLENPQQDIAELATTIAGELGIKNINASAVVRSKLMNAEVGSDGKAILDPNVYPENSIRSIAKKIGIKDWKDAPIKDLGHRVYEAEQLVIKENIDKQFRNKEIDDAADRKSRDPIEKENLTNEIHKRLTNPDKSVEQLAQEVVQLSLEFGMTPKEANTNTKKARNDVKGGEETVLETEPATDKPAKVGPLKQKPEAGVVKIHNKDFTTEIVDGQPVKDISLGEGTYRLKKLKADDTGENLGWNVYVKEKGEWEWQEGGLDYRTSVDMIKSIETQKQKDRQEPKSKVTTTAKTRKQKKKANRIAAAVEKRLDEIDAEISTTKQKPKVVDAKSTNDIKKPHGAKDITFREEKIAKDGTITYEDVPVEKFKGKKVFDNEEQFKEWRDSIPNRHASTVSVIVKRAKNGKITAQAFEKLTPKAKFKHKKLTKLKEKEAMLLDRDYMSRREQQKEQEHNPLVLLRDPTHKPMETIDKIHTLISEVQYLESSRGLMSMELANLKLDKTVRQGKWSYTPKTTEKILAMKNSIDATDALMARGRRQINVLRSTVHLRDGIIKKLNILTDNINLAKVTSEGFIDWSGRKDKKYNKTELDLLRDDLKADFVEYLSRAFAHSTTPIGKMSATEIGRVLSEKYGLPKKTITDFMKGRMPEILEHMENYQFAQLVDAVEGDNYELDLTVTGATGNIVTVGTTTKAVQKVWKNQGLTQVADWVDTLGSLVHNQMRRASEIRDYDSWESTRRATEKHIPELTKWYDDIYNWNVSGGGLKKSESDKFGTAPHLINRMPEMVDYSIARLVLSSEAVKNSKAGTPEMDKAIKIQTGHQKTLDHILHEIGTSLNKAKDREHADPKVMEKMLKHWGMTYGDATARILYTDTGTKKPKRTKELMPYDTWKGMVAYSMVKGSSALLELYRGNLLFAGTPTVKSLLGDTFSLTGEYLVNGIDNMLTQGPRYRAYQKAIKDFDPKSDKYIKLTNEYYQKGGLSWAWAKEHGSRTAQSQTIKMMLKESMQIMLETGEFLELNPQYGGDIIVPESFGISSNFAKHHPGLKWVDLPINIGGKVIRASTNWMGVIDNIFRVPLFQGEFNKLAWHEAINMWRMERGIDKHGNATIFPDIKNSDHISQVEKYVNDIKGDHSSKVYSRIRKSADMYSRRMVFQDPFYWGPSRAIQGLRTQQGGGYMQRLETNVANFALPFIVSGINGIKMAHEWMPTGAFTPNLHANRSYMKNRVKGVHSSFARRFEPFDKDGVDAGSVLSQAEYRKQIIKLMVGSAVSVGIVGKLLTEDEHDEERKRIAEDYYGYSGKHGRVHTTQGEREEINLRESLGIQSTGHYIKDKEGDITGSWTINSADPLTTYLQFTDANTGMATGLYKGYKYSVDRMTREIFKDRPEVIEALLGVSEARRGNGVVEMNDAMWDYMYTSMNAFESMPQLQLFDKIMEGLTRPDGDKVADIFLGKIHASTSPLNTTLFNQLLSIREGVRYQPYGKEIYDDNGLMFRTLANTVRGIGGSEAQNPAFATFFKDKKQLSAAEWNELDKAKSMVPFLEIFNMSEEVFMKEIKFPYPLVDIKQVHYSDKYPLLTMFGTTIDNGGPEKLWGLKMIESTKDPVVRALGKEYLWLKDNEAKIPAVFTDVNIPLSLFSMESYEKNLQSNTVNKFSGRIKLDEKHKFERHKLIGDLYKDKMWNIINGDDLLSKQYRIHRNKIDEIDTQMKAMGDVRDKRYKDLEMEKHMKIEDISGVWKNVAESIREIVDNTVFGEEMHNVAFWEQHMKTFMNDPTLLNMEFTALFPERTPEEVEGLVDAYWDILYQEQYAGQPRNMVQNEVYRRWAKHKGIDRDHANDPININNLLGAMSGGYAGSGQTGTYYPGDELDIDKENKGLTQKTLSVPEEKQIQGEVKMFGGKGAFGFEHVSPRGKNKETGGGKHEYQSWMIDPKDSKIMRKLEQFVKPVEQ